MYKSAIDISLENNQIVGVNIIIDYIATYQNSYAYSFLFETNFTHLIEHKIDITKLLKSDIIYH